MSMTTLLYIMKYHFMCVREEVTSANDDICSCSFPDSSITSLRANCQYYDILTFPSTVNKHDIHLTMYPRFFTVQLSSVLSSRNFRSCNSTLLIESKAESESYQIRYTKAKIIKTQRPPND